jgi:peptidyl-prolyl cis-trans isomerase-like 3
LYSLSDFAAATPRNAENFLALCASGYYDKCKFHRNIAGFIVQTGDPTGTGKGGHAAGGGTVPDEIKSSLKHNARGVVGLAHSGKQPDSGGSQFYISYDKAGHLDGKFTVFGRCVVGQRHSSH